MSLKLCYLIFINTFCVVCDKLMPLTNMLFLFLLLSLKADTHHFGEGIPRISFVWHCSPNYFVTLASLTGSRKVCRRSLLVQDSGDVTRVSFFWVLLLSWTQWSQGWVASTVNELLGNQKLICRANHGRELGKSRFLHAWFVPYDVFKQLQC